MTSKVREITWPDEFSDLKRIEEFMVCGICYEYMDTTVITPCSHNYCSLCIRKYLHFKTQCPACFHNFFEKDLYINRAMDGLIQHYLQVRENLISLMENRVIYNSVVQQKQETPSTPPVRPAWNNQTPKSHNVSIKETLAIESKAPIEKLSSGSTLNSSPSTSRSQIMVPSIAKMFSTPKRKDVTPQLIVVNVKTVSCPVCKVDISEHHVNLHLDACLKRESSQGVTKDKPSVMKSKRPPLPKLVLRVMKDAELRKKLKELGLPVQGDRRALESRFTRYSTIYNAESDKVDPRPIPDLIRQCEMEEKQERKMDSFLIAAPTTNRLQVDRNAKEEVIEEAQKNYREANKSSFDKLIEEVRKRKNLNKQIEEQKDSNDNFDNIPSTSTGVAKVFENKEKEITTDKLPTNVSYQDSNSDSDEQCPLQHYKSDDPLKYFSVNNLNDSSPSKSISGSPVKKVQTNIKIRRQLNKSLASVRDDPYEVSTDVSSDEDVLTSPVLKKRTNRKKAKFSNKASKKLDSSVSISAISNELFLQKSNSSVLSTSMISNHDLIEKDSKQAEARNLCESIIHDFSFDDSSNEFENKPQQKKLQNKEIKNLSNDSFNTLNTDKVTDSSCDMHKINVENNVNNEFCSVKDFVLACETDNFSDDVSKNITETNQILDEKLNKTLNFSFCLNDIENGKENDSSSVNGSSQNSLKETVAGRPVRKRSRPLRYTYEQVPNKEDKEKSPNLLEEIESPESCKNSVSTDGSLKRRRGRQKINFVDPLDEQQNPPKRPVRRRQAAADPSLC